MYTLEGTALIQSSKEANDPEFFANFKPWGMVDRIHVGDHWTLLYTEYIYCVSHVIIIREIFLFVLDLILYIPVNIFQLCQTNLPGLNQYFNVSCSRTQQGAQWLSGRVLDSRQRGRRFEPHRRHCVVSLSKTH